MGRISWPGEDPLVGGVSSSNQWLTASWAERIPVWASWGGRGTVWWPPLWEYSKLCFPEALGSPHQSQAWKTGPGSPGGRGGGRLRVNGSLPRAGWAGDPRLAADLNISLIKINPGDDDFFSKNMFCFSVWAKSTWHTSDSLPPFTPGRLFCHFYGVGGSNCGRLHTRTSTFEANINHVHPSFPLSYFHCLHVSGLMSCCVCQEDYAKTHVRLINSDEMSQ